MRLLRRTLWGVDLGRIGIWAGGAWRDDDLAGEGSDRLVDDVVAWGDAGAIGRRLEDHFQAGADHVCLQVLTESGDFPRAEYRALAEALLPG